MKIFLVADSLPGRKRGMRGSILHQIWKNKMNFRESFRRNHIPERVIKQLEAVSPYVEKILIYQYTGMLNNPSTKVFAGHPDSAELFSGLAEKKYLRK